jgi:hypothetical protein
MSPYFSTEKLTGQSIITWESVTEEHIRRHILNAGLKPELFDLTVGTNIVDQWFPIISSSDGTRSLQTVPPNSLIIQFDVSLMYRSEGQDRNLDLLVFNAWDTVMDRAEYVMELQSKSKVFDDIQDVIVEIKNYVTPTIDDGTEKKKVNIAVVIGASVGGAALIILVAFVLLRKNNGKGLDNNNENSRTTPETDRKIAVAT